MQNAWRVVDCTNLSGQLKYSRGHLKVCNDHDNKTNVIALSDIAVLLIGLRCSCSAGLLHQCAQYGVSIMPCDWRGVPVAAFHPWLETHTRIAARQIAQSYMTMPRKKSAWAKVVKNKIAGQASCLRILGRQGEGSLHVVFTQVMLLMLKVVLLENIGDIYFHQQRVSNVLQELDMGGMRNWIMDIWFCAVLL